MILQPHFFLSKPRLIESAGSCSADIFSNQRIFRKAGKAFLWGPILDLKKYGENNGESGFCGVGLIQIYIKVDGRIFGCAANLEDSGCIGDVENGLSKECIKRLRKIGKEGNMCSKCSFAVKCQSKNCIMNSLAYSGTVGES